MAEENQNKYEETTATNSETEIKDRGVFDFLGGKKKDEEHIKPQEDAVATDFSHKVTLYEAPSETKVEEKEEGEKKHTSLLEKLHRSDSSSSSSSEEEVDGERRKKKKKEKKKKEDTSVPVEKVDVVDGTTASTEEKKGFLDKIKEKLPGHKKTDDVTTPPPVVVAPAVPSAETTTTTASHDQGEKKEGDCVRMRSSKPWIPTYVAMIEEMKADSRDVRVRWYYWPEETKKGRRHFHGSKELFLSDHLDVQSVDTIEGKCTVHSLENYMKLDVVGDDDFFCRLNYNSATGALTPDIVQVYCKCEMPYNPDEVMIQCDRCTDWFHPACIDMTVEEAERIDNFICESCSAEVQKKLQDSHSAARLPNTKVDTKRRQR